MINWLIDWSIRNRVIVIAIYIAIAAAGYWAVLRTPIDAIPDLSDNQVIVFTDWAGQLAERGRGPDNLSAGHEPPGAAGRADGAGKFGIQLLDGQRDLRGRRRALLGPDTDSRTPESGSKAASRRRDADARAGRFGPWSSFLVHAGIGEDEPAGPSHAAGLVRPVSTQLDARDRRGRERRRVCSAVSDRRRSEQAAGL